METFFWFSVIIFFIIFYLVIFYFAFKEWVLRRSEEEKDVSKIKNIDSYFEYKRRYPFWWMD